MIGLLEMDGIIREHELDRWQVEHLLVVARGTNDKLCSANIKLSKISESLFVNWKKKRCKVWEDISSEEVSKLPMSMIVPEFTVRRKIR